VSLWKKLDGPTDTACGLYELEPYGVIVRVKPSPIHGLGLFAGKTQIRGELLGLYDGSPTFDVENPYTLIETGKQDVEWGVMGVGPLRYMNHARPATCSVDGFLIHARKGIPIGSELTIDYGPDYD